MTTSGRVAADHARRPSCNHLADEAEAANRTIIQISRWSNGRKRRKKSWTVIRILIFIRDTNSGNCQKTKGRHGGNGVRCVGFPLLLREAPNFSTALSNVLFELHCFARCIYLCVRAFLAPPMYTQHRSRDFLAPPFSAVLSFFLLQITLL